MTAQATDILFLDRQRYSLCSNPLESYFSEAHPRPKFIGIQTDNWRGYVAQWEIDEGRLYLTSLQGQVSGDDPQDSTDTSKVTLEDVFPGNTGKVPADWFSGTLRVPEGKLLKLVDDGYESVFERDRLITLENGFLQGEQIVDNTQ